MILQALSFIIPHFVTRYLIYNDQRQLIGVYQGYTDGNHVALEPEGHNVAGPNTSITESLGISWLGYAIFFWIRASYDWIEPQT